MKTSTTVHTIRYLMRQSIRAWSFVNVLKFSLPALFSTTALLFGLILLAIQFFFFSSLCIFVCIFRVLKHSGYKISPTREKSTHILILSEKAQRWLLFSLSSSFFLFFVLSSLNSLPLFLYMISLSVHGHKCNDANRTIPVHIY